MRWFDAIKEDLNYIPTKLENCMQTHLRKPSSIHLKRLDFERDYVLYGLEYTLRKYALIGWRYEVGVFKKRVINRIRSLFFSRGTTK